MGAIAAAAVAVAALTVYAIPLPVPFRTLWTIAAAAGAAWFLP